MNGYIKIYRKVLDNPIVCKDADYFAIWMYLLLNATHKELDTIFNGKRITLKKGQLIVGRINLSKQFSTSESKVQRILKVFENEQQIEQQTCNKNRLITITNWELYQDSEQQNEQQVNNKRTTSEQQVNTNKNDKNDKNVINNIKEIKEKFKKPTIDEIQNYCNERKNNINSNNFYDFYESKNWFVGRNKMKDWKACIRTWENKNKKNKSSEPVWFNKNIEKQEVSESEKAELEELLKEFK